jgi:hypothetical protein
VDMHIPSGVFMPLYIASFIMLAFQYFRINPERRVLNLHFGLMVAAVVLMFAAVFLGNLSLSPVFFLLALFSLGLTLVLFRHMPPPRN